MQKKKKHGLLQKLAVLDGVCAPVGSFSTEETIVRKWRIGWSHLQSTLHTLPLLVSTLTLSRSELNGCYRTEREGGGD